MTARRTKQVLALALSAVLTTIIVPRTGRADDQGVAGLKLVLIDKYAVTKAKAVFVSKDTTAGAIHNGSGSGDPADLSGNVKICPTAAPSNMAVYDLPSPWLVNKTTVSKYVNKLAAPGGDGAKVVVAKPATVLKVVAKNLGDGDAASGDDSATDLNLNDPPGTCTVSVGNTMNVEVTIDDAATSTTHRMCAEFTVEAAKSIGGGTGCKVISKSSVAGSCGVCGGGPTTTSTTVATTTTTSTLPMIPPPCAATAIPFCDGFCGPGGMCLDPGGGCVCVPAGGMPCGAAMGPPLCYGECMFAGQACMDVGGLCVCRDTTGPVPPVCPASISPACDGDCGGLGTMCLDPGGGCACVPSGGMACGVAAPFPTCYGECPAGFACRTAGFACVCAP